MGLDGAGRLGEDDRMNYHVRCTICGAEWWFEGDYEPDTNATNLDDTKINEGECDCGDALYIFDEESICMED